MIKKIIAIHNNKGGAGKTTITTNLAGVLAKKNQKVLIIDFDGQGHSTLSFNKLNPDHLKHTIFEYLVGSSKLDDCIVNVYENIDILPANRNLNAYAQFEATGKIKNSISKIIKAVQTRYDVVLIDMAPALDGRIPLVLDVSTDLVIPFNPNLRNSQSVATLASSIAAYEAQTPIALQKRLLLPVMFVKTDRIHNGIVNGLTNELKGSKYKMSKFRVFYSRPFANSDTKYLLPASLALKNNKVVDQIEALAWELGLISKPKNSATEDVTLTTTIDVTKQDIKPKTKPVTKSKTK